MQCYSWILWQLKWFMFQKIIRVRRRRFCTLQLTYSLKISIYTTNTRFQKLHSHFPGKDIYSVLNWSQQNQVKFNPDKFQLVIFLIEITLIPIFLLHKSEEMVPLWVSCTYIFMVVVQGSFMIWFRLRWHGSMLNGSVFCQLCVEHSQFVELVAKRVFPRKL